MSRPCVAYYRVSTLRQGQSGLGLEAQRWAVAQFITGGGWTLVSEFTEIESGRRRDRPQLQAAITTCRLHRATLIVAKLDRLARNAHFLLGLKESGIEFIAVDMPSANRLTVSIMAMVAEEEAQAISARTKAALAAARTRGVKLGKPNNLTCEARMLGSAAGNAELSRRAKARALDVLPTIQALRGQGIVTLAGLATALTQQGIPTPRGRVWRPVQVKRVLDHIS